MKAPTQQAAPAAPKTLAAPRGGLLQRRCACGGSAGLTGACEECGEKHLTLRRSATGRAAPASVPPVVYEVLGSPGRPLDAPDRLHMESRLGHDFSRVRVHTDARAAESARAVGARAYTVGRDIVFAAGQYAPETARGRRLLAHELAHTIQQGGGADPALRRAGDSLEIGAADDPHEREAERIATAAADDGAHAHVPAPCCGGGERAPVLRRQQSGAGGGQPQQQPQQQGQAAASQRALSAPPVRWESNVNLGYFTRYYHGEADARLDRTAALEYLRRGGSGERPPCQIDLFLKLAFEFHLGPSPRRVGGPQGGMSEPGPPWPAERAARWKQSYMRVAQQFWRTRHTLERTGECPDEPCTRAVGQLHVIDVATMTDSEGRPVPNPQMSTAPHFTVQVYESRPLSGRNESRVGMGHSMLYDEDVVPRGTPPPPGHDDTQYEWRPGGAEHETGHMLGRPHVNCGPNTEEPNREVCYGETDMQRANVMGRGGEMSREDHAPFIAALRQTTSCSWHVPSGGGLPLWAMVLIGLTGIGLLVLGIMALAGVL